MVVDKKNKEQILIILGLIVIFYFGSQTQSTFITIDYSPSVVTPKYIGNWTLGNACSVQVLGNEQVDGCYVSENATTTGALIVQPNSTYSNSTSVYIISYTLHYAGNQICESENPYNETCASSSDCGSCPQVQTQTITISNTITTTVIKEPPSFFENFWMNWNNFILQLKTWLHLQMVI